MKPNYVALREITMRRTSERLQKWHLNSNRPWAWALRSTPLRVYTPEHTYVFNDLTELNNWLDAMEMVRGTE
jgi:hypothetical protein